ncbi:hypothetical protein Emed_000122 [Eimeria media]
MTSSFEKQQDAADLAATLVRLGPLDRINDCLTHAANLNPSLEPLIRDKFLGLPNVLFDAELRNSYRSPWTNTWVPPIPEAAKPPPQLRQLEAYLNEVYDAYREAHYEGGISSVYAWPLQNQDGFAAAFLLLKEIPYDEPSRPLCFFNHKLEVLRVEQTQKIQDSRAAAAAGSGAPAGLQHMAVGGPLLEKNEAALLEEVAEIHLLRAAELFKDPSKQPELQSDMLQLMKELEASRPPSSSFSLTKRAAAAAADAAGLAGADERWRMMAAAAAAAAAAEAAAAAAEAAAAAGAAAAAAAAEWAVPTSQAVCREQFPTTPAPAAAAAREATSAAATAATAAAVAAA